MRASWNPELKSTLMFAEFWNDPERRELMAGGQGELLPEWRRTWLEGAFAHADNPVDRMLWVDSHTSLPGDLLVKMDIASMHCGLETRSPLLDHEVIEFCARLPVQHKVKDRVGKYLLKKLAERYFPANFVHRLKMGLQKSRLFQGVLEALPEDSVAGTLEGVARGELLPDIRYRVQPLTELIASGEASEVALVYSQAAIEHIWNVEDFWRMVIGLTKSGGWHSHRIDLADHGRRETNYIEMLEWSPIGYWLTLRFVPGAINRWRASMHLDFLVQSGLNILSTSRETRGTFAYPTHAHRPEV